MNFLNTNYFRTTMSEAGDYKICFDNLFSRFNTKTVFFGLVIESDEDDDQEGDVCNKYLL